MSSPFQEVAKTIDLKTALRRGAESNDLIPPRLEDNVGGEVGKRFSEDVGRGMERGYYDPAPAQFIAVPKSPHATRPAALLNLADRVVYEALVSSLQARIEKALLGKAILFWPRGEPSGKAWRDFEQSPLLEGSAYVVIADVSAFYESIDHAQLGERLVRMTGQRAVAEALHHFLDRVMVGSRGLPQGLAASDPLATAYLAQVDFAMIREGYQYSRHGDDIRIAAKTYDDARRAIFTLESYVRAAGLQLNSLKSKILKRTTYENEFRSLDETIRETKRRVLEGRIKTLAENPAELERTIRASEDDQLSWDFFYHGRLSLDAVIDQLRPQL